MAENRVSVDGAVSTTVSGTVTTVPGPLGNFYTFNLADVPGVVAANNFLSFFNPVASGKTITIFRSTITPWTGSASNTDVSMRVFRITAASGGTLVALNTVPKFNTSQPDSVVEIRTGNPTVTTTGLQVFSAPPGLSAGATGATAQLVTEIPPGATFVLQPGQGLVATTSSGNTGQLWNFAVTWIEA